MSLPLSFFWMPGQETLKPDHISDRGVAEANGADYLFFDALRFIFKVCLRR